MPDPDPDLASRLERIAAGDHDAARELVERCHPLVAKLACAHRPRSLSEEDLVQEVFMKMFAHLDRYQPRAGIPFEHWLSRLAVNTCLDALRAERRRPVERSASAGGRGSIGAIGEGERGWLESLAVDGAPAVEDALAARELVEMLLARLEPRDRLLLTLLDLEERSVAEVAEATGWNRTLIKVRAFRARRRLRAVAERLRREPS